MTAQLNFDDNNWEQFHDIIQEASGFDMVRFRLKHLAEKMPENLSEDVQQLGMDDPICRAKIIDWVKAQTCYTEADIVYKDGDTPETVVEFCLAEDKDSTKDFFRTGKQVSIGEIFCNVFYTSSTRYAHLDGQSGHQLKPGWAYSCRAFCLRESEYGHPDYETLVKEMLSTANHYELMSAGK